MSTAELSHGAVSRGPRLWPLRFLRAVGGAVLTPVAGLWWLCGLAAAVIAQGIRPDTWRRTVRAELVRQIVQIGVTAQLATVAVGALVGVGLVVQALYWLGEIGQTDVVGQLIVVVLVRELGPLIVGLLVIGRSVGVILAEVVEIRASGRLASLDAMGIDPFHLLVVPRVLAMALCGVCLNVLFLAATLSLGYWTAALVGLAELSFGGFIANVFQRMGLAEFAITVAKPLLIGFSVGLIACGIGLRSHDDVRTLLPRSFVASMTAALLISVTISALL